MFHHLSQAYPTERHNDAMVASKVNRSKMVNLSESQLHANELTILNQVKEEIGNPKHKRDHKKHTFHHKHDKNHKHTDASTQFRKLILV